MPPRSSLPSNRIGQLLMSPGQMSRCACLLYRLLFAFRHEASHRLDSQPTLPVGSNLGGLDNYKEL